MLRAVLLVQLTLWVASIQAFYVWVPGKLCDEYGICKDGKREVESPVERTVSPTSGATFELTQRVPATEEEPSARASRAADFLRGKYSSARASRTTDRHSNNVARAGQNKYAVVTAATPAGTNSVGLNQDGTDFSYFIQAGIGSGLKPLFMLLDTGAGTTWVMGSSCKSSPCTVHNSFGPADSTTYQATTKTFSIGYGSGSVGGELAKDTVAVAGLRVPMSFGVANETSNDFNNFPFDGILGLSMSPGATDNFLQVIKTAKSLPANIFGVSLNRNADGPNTGEVTFGATNPAKFTGAIGYTPVAAGAGGDWAIPLDDVTFNGKKAGVTGRLAYIDTGTSFCFGPQDDVTKVHQLVPGAKTADSGVTWTVPCDTTAPLTVSFSGVSYTISPKDWVAKANSAGVCSSNLYGHEVVTGEWLLGDMFLKNVYTVFDVDQSRIGFAAKPAAPAPATVSTSTLSSSLSASSSVSSTGSSASASASSAATRSSSATSLTTAPPSTTTVPSSFPGLSGHETAATAAGTPVPVTSDPSSTPSNGVGSPADQRGSSAYVSIICIVAVMAMVA